MKEKMPLEGGKNPGLATSLSGATFHLDSRVSAPQRTAITLAGLVASPWLGRHS